MLAVTYDANTAANGRSALEARERSVGANVVNELTFAHTGLTTHVVSVPPAQEAAIAAKLRAQAGVKSVGETGQRRYLAAVTNPFFPSDPYFGGFGATAPLYETANSPGQWDAHVTQLEHAFGYSQAGNGSGIVNPAALGSSAIKIASIDSGQDTTHPELHSKIVYQKCFITDSNVQSTSNFTTDEDGHGTDTAGIAAEDTGNSFGFSGAGGNSVLYGYRVFPTPDDNCANPSSSDNQCGADTDDIASAINDAVAQHVNVITLSLGGGNCTNGVDQDPVEGQAISEALAANIVVVASAGNDRTADAAPPVEAPACDSGVIAAGATAIADGQLNGTGAATGSAANPNEYVASYSNFGSPAKALNSASAWGIVAPGGDPNPSTANPDPDDLHWIENIWTSTPFQASASDMNFTGDCTDDAPNGGSTIPPVDCRVLIAGTSMSAPRIAGAAALILAVNPTYQGATKMKTLLCQTADDINDPDEGCGRLNVYRAMATALGDPAPPGPSSP